MQNYKSKLTQFKPNQIPYNKLAKGDFEYIPIYCQCPCHQQIILKKERLAQYEYKGYPKYIHGHNNVGIKFLNEHKNKIRDALISKNNPMFGKEPWNKNKILSEEHCKNLSKSHAGQHSSPLTEFKKGQISLKLHIFSALDRLIKQKYCTLFNDSLKKLIRLRDNYTCQNCGITQEEHKIKSKQALHVHHIHYLKSDCYPDLITLCDSCNNKANFNRPHWESFYMNKLNDRGLLFWTKNRNN